MRKKIKIILPESQRVSSENVDLLLNLDINRTFTEFKKERYDNDFDLAKQFQKERDTSKNFIIYGELHSTIINCNDIEIRVYRDSGYTQLHTIINSSGIAYNRPNIFGRKNGKYVIKLINYKYENVYMLIRSDNFYYKDQKWSQKLVFKDGDDNFVSYGTQTIEINYEGEAVEINNDFPFFYNKHWIRNDYKIIEEKVSKISLDIASQTLEENSIGSLKIFLDKPSPFGQEKANLCITDIANTSNSYRDLLFSLPETDKILPVSVPDSDPLSEFNGRALVIVYCPPEKSNLLSEGSPFYILNGEYKGNYTISKKKTFSLDGYPNYYYIILNTQYDSSLNVNDNYQFLVGSRPDLVFEINDSPVQLPYLLEFQTNEQQKNLKFTASTDFEIELQERFLLSFEEKIRLNDGPITQSEISINDITPKKTIIYNFGPIYENRSWFTGRTYSPFPGQVNNENLRTDSRSVLRNGQFYEGRNEEFYPNDVYNIKITNKGIKTLIPPNPSLGINSETVFDAEESRDFTINTNYVSQQKHKVELLFKHNTISADSLADQLSQIGGDNVYVSINGVKFVIPQIGYLSYKQLIDGGPADRYNYFKIHKPFEAEFDDANKRVVLTAKNSGIRLDVLTNTNWQGITATTIQNYIQSQQYPSTIKLFANSDNNSTARYSFIISKLGYRSLRIDSQALMANTSDTPYYLISCLDNVLRPYYSDIQEGYHYSSSTIDDQGLGYYQVIGNQPTYMPAGKAFLNGFCLLAENILYESRTNLTVYGVSGLTNQILGSNNFTAGFFPEPLTVLPQTNNPIIEFPTKKTMELKIPVGIWNTEAIRKFDFNYLSVGNPTVLRFGGQSFGQVAGQAYNWWTYNGLPTTDENNNTLPIATMQERLDTGNVNNNIPVGPIVGFLLNSNTISLTTKVAGNDFSITNIINFQSINNQSDIVPKVLVPNLLQGDINTANNHLGGFNIDI